MHASGAGYVYILVLSNCQGRRDRSLEALTWNQAYLVLVVLYFEVNLWALRER